MKYKDIPQAQAREICREHARKNKNGTVITDCEKCPLRREKIDEKGNVRTLFCYWKIQDLITDLIDDWEDLRHEEIKHYEEIKNK